MRCHMINCTRTIEECSSTSACCRSVHNAAAKLRHFFRGLRSDRRGPLSSSALSAPQSPRVGPAGRPVENAHRALSALLPCPAPAATLSAAGRCRACCYGNRHVRP
eukprot:6185098-Pleurochrysis_carterae.AAC.3